MMIRHLPLCATTFALACISFAAASAQRDERPDWQIAAGGTAIHISELNGTGFGATALLSRYFGEHVGAEFGPTVILESDGFYRAGGISADLGASYGGRTGNAELTVSAGPSMLAVGDSDGSFLAFGGGYAAVRGTWWPGGEWLGLFARGSVRLWHTGEFAPAATAGLSIRF